MNPKQLDDLIESFEGVSSSELIAALFDLEMNGLVRQLPGKQLREGVVKKVAFPVCSGSLLVGSGIQLVL